MAPGGVMSMQYGPAYGPHRDSCAKVMSTVRGVFEEVRPGRVFIPSFHGCWGIALAGDRLPELDADGWDTRIEARLERPLRSLDGQAMPSVFSLPKDLRERLSGR